MVKLAVREVSAKAEYAVQMEMMELSASRQFTAQKDR
jgi:hypothetical protein